MESQTYNTLPSSSVRLAALVRYREALIGLQKSISDGVSLEKEARLLVEAERSLAKDVQELFDTVTDDFIDLDGLKTLEWCLLEHAKMCAGWLDEFQKKKFRNFRSYKVWVPVILNVYVRLNRITFLSRVLRNQQSSDVIFVNLIRAFNFAVTYKNIATIVDPPFGDGAETVVGALISCSLIQHSVNSNLSPSGIKALDKWYRSHLGYIKVSTMPFENLGATLVVLLDRMTVPQWAPFNGVQDAPKRVFFNVLGLRDKVEELANDPRFSYLPNQLFRRDSSFVKVMPIELTPFNFPEVFEWLVEPHKPFVSPDFKTYETENAGDTDIVVRFPKDKYPRINQLWIARLKDTPLLHVGYIKKVELNDYHALALIEWVGRRPLPVEARSEWADIADSLRSTDWLNGVVLESLEQKSVLKMFMPHTSLTPGETISCRIPSNHKDWGDLFFSRLLELYPNFQLIEVRRI